MKVGTIKEIYRYPVKSMGGERLAEASILENGLVGDRSFAFKMNSKFLTAIEMPELFAHYAKITSNGKETSATIATPSGLEYDWNDPNLVDYISKKMKTDQLEVLVSQPDERGAYWEDHILIISQSSLEKVEELSNVPGLSMKRFRPNLVIALDSQLPFEEEEWIGKKLVINDVQLIINSHCPRCAYINIDPQDPSKKNPGVLKTLVKEREGNLGVYASVLKTGTIKEGSEIFLAK